MIYLSGPERQAPVSSQSKIIPQNGKPIGFIVPAKIAADLDIVVEKLGHESILPVYPEFPDLYQTLFKVREKITESKRNRDSREAIYSTLESVTLPEFVAKFNKMRAS